MSTNGVTGSNVSQVITAELSFDDTRERPARRLAFTSLTRSDKGVRFFLDLFIVYVSVIIDFMGYTLLAPLLSTIVDQLGSGGFSDDAFAASWLMAMYGLGQFISVMIMGPLSDRVGRRPVFILAYSLTSLVYLIQGFSNSYWMFAVLRLCNGLTTGTRPVTFSYLGDIAPPEKMPLYSSLAGAMVAIGALMPLLGGSMGTITWRLPVFFSAGITFIMACLAFIFLRESLKKGSTVVDSGGVANGGVRMGTSIMRTPLFIVTLTLIALTGACVQYGNISIITTLPWLLNQVYGTPLNTVGLILGSQAIPTSLTLFLVFLPLSKRVPMSILAMIGMLGHATMFILPLLGNVYGVIFTSYLLNFGNSMVYSSVPVMAKVIAPAPRRGLVNGIVLASMLLAGAVGPLIAGVLWDADSEHITAFAVVSGVAALGAVCMLFTWRLIPLLMTRVARRADEDLTDEQIENLYEELADLQGMRECRMKLAAHIKHRKGVAHREDAAVEEALRITRALSLSDLKMGTSPHSDEDIWRLGCDVSAILDRNNWNRWPHYYEWILAQVGSAFPPIREAPEQDRYEDVTWVMQKHLEIVSEWEKRQLGKFKKDR